MIYPAKNLRYTLFLDIETVPEFEHYDEMSELYQTLWDKKSKSLIKDQSLWNKEVSAALYREKAGIFAEFSKVICISVAYMKDNERLRMKSFYGHDELQILKTFSDLLVHYYDDPKSYYLCGHNIKEFDIPVLCRRMLKHRIFMPNMLDIAGKKPWQTEHLVDTLELWKFGDIKNYTSLSLLCAMLNIPTPKDDIDGSRVASVYYDDGELERIKRYCEKDVISVAQIMLRFCDLEALSEAEIVYIED